MLKKPEVKQLSRKNDIRPFEDTSSLEFLCERNECAAFIYATHNKKRPHNLVLVRRTERERRAAAVVDRVNSPALTPFPPPSFPIYLLRRAAPTTATSTTCSRSA
jgi:hypothetical protein